jgi:TPR repeat protein
MDERPKLRVLGMAVLAFALAAPLAAWSSNVDDDMRRAAKLQRQGDTAAAVDRQKALHWYRYAAERGDRVSQYQIGLMYLNGRGCPPTGRKRTAGSLPSAPAMRTMTIRRRCRRGESRLLH